MDRVRGGLQSDRVQFLVFLSGWWKLHYYTLFRMFEGAEEHCQFFSCAPIELSPGTRLVTLLLRRSRGVLIRVLVTSCVSLLSTLDTLY